MNMVVQPLEVDIFTGGITDYVIDGRPDQAEKLDNLWINPNGKPFTRWGSNIFVPSQIPIGIFRVSKLEFLNDNLFTFAQRRVYENDGSTFTELQGPGSGAIFDLGDANSIITSTEWQGHLFLTNDAYSSPQKIYRDELGNYQLRNAGLPAFNTTGLVITNPPGSGASYVYTFLYKYTYKVDDVTYTDRGPVYQSGTIQGGTITTGNGTVITLPTTLTANENWDAANIEIEIYRTQNGQTDFFLAGSVALGTVSFTDEVEDSALANNLGLYTNSSAFPSLEAPPRCKFVHVVNDLAYYANLQTGADDDEYLVRQSIPGDPDSVPASFFARAEQKIVGVSSIYDRPMVFCEKYIYRIDNIIAANGTGNMDLRRIDDRAGCVSQNSIVQTHKGVFWAGEVGFYWSDGFRVVKISNQLNDTYAKFVTNDTRKKRIQGTYEPSNERVIWTVCKDDGSNEPDMLFCLDIKWHFQSGPPSEACFTTASGGTQFRPTAIAVNQNKIYRGDTRGYVLEHSPAQSTDPKIDTSVAIADWEKLTIVHDYTSCFLDFGTKFIRKLVSRILISAANTTNLSLAIHSSNDNNRVTGDLKPIRYRSNITWGDDLPLWGDAEAQWNSQGLIEEWRRFPAKGLRCNYKQVQITNASVQIVTSSLLGTATVNSVAKTAVLGGSSRWINDSVDYVIAFENDGYSEEFTITQRTDTTLTFSDPSNKAPNGVYNWVIRGKPKGEVLELNGYVIHWALLSKTHTPFSAASSGSTP